MGKITEKELMEAIKESGLTIEEVYGMVITKKAKQSCTVKVTQPLKDYPYYLQEIQSNVR
jgi:hypothetical protein